MSSRAHRAVILLYHRVTEATFDPWQLCVTPARFERHLAYLRRNCRVVSLRELKEIMDGGVVPDNTVVVTFDDGYTDNLTAAMPVLERFSIPATVFVATGAIDAEYDFWWDELVTLLLVPTALPALLELHLPARALRFQLLETDSAARGRSYFSWRPVSWTRTVTRHELYYALCRELRTVNPELRNDAMARIAEWAGSSGDRRRRHPTLTEAELRKLASSAMIEIGAHTVTHPVLSALPYDQQRLEIERSRRRLGEILGSAVASFAYPHGMRGDFSTETSRLVSRTGFDCACSAQAGVVKQSTDRFALPRLSVGNWDCDDFEMSMRSWMIPVR